MGGIADAHVEWAIVNRLKAMLEDPPKTKFNVTQTFALFSAILLWTKSRIFVGGNRPERAVWFDDADHAARDVRDALQAQNIFEAPWSLSKAPPRLSAVRTGVIAVPEPEINTDFVDMKAEQFVKWLRDAIAHGDGRAIRPIHKLSRKGNKTLLAGFEIAFPADRGSRRVLKLSLYHADLSRIGGILADAFCKSLSGGNRYFEQDAGTASIREAA